MERPGHPLAPPSVNAPATVRSRRPWLTLAVVAAAAVIQASPALGRGLIFERAAILHGEAWRLWTGNLVHFGGSHLLWNLVVFGAAGVWAERTAPGKTRGFIALAPGLIGIVLLLGAPSLQWYAGLSGLAAGMLVLLALEQLAGSRGDRWFWWTVLGLVAAKIGFETVAGQALFARFGETGVRVAPLSHVAGVAGAVVAHVCPRRI
ncbi:MAG: Rhomboid family protein [Verrucomicrobia bacterium]|nr:Rhomboid family protein [Verrucomicrobiota bacterium]